MNADHTDLKPIVSYTHEELMEKMRNAEPDLKARKAAIDELVFKEATPKHGLLLWAVNAQPKS